MTVGNIKAPNDILRREVLLTHPKIFMAHLPHILATGPLFFCSWQPAVTENHGFCMGKYAFAMTPRYFELAVRLFPIVPSANVMF